MCDEHACLLRVSMLIFVAAGGPLVMVEHQVNKFRWKRKAEKRKRRLHQVFLRGDNIVTIEPVLQDVQKHWAQLVLQWASAGIPESAFAVPPQLGVPSHSRAASLPTEAAQPAAVASHSAAVAQLTPAWAHNKR